MIPREASARLAKLAKTFRSVAVVGPRQSGKTTLCRNIFPQKPYVSLENSDILEFANADARGFLSQYKNGAILDEVQRAPHLFSYLQQVLDEIQNLSFTEQQRQQDIEAQKQITANERKNYIQYALLALGIITFIILFLLLSRSFITNEKVIRFFGVIALLNVFEFLNLLLHPFLERVTNHSPVLMLLALVCIATLLVPAHHLLEKWMTHTMVEKNKKIRLEAAKKTIAKLEVNP